MTPEQSAILDAVRDGVSNLVVEAVAGAGKTSTIVAAVRCVPAHLTCLFCAFNRHVARELETVHRNSGRGPARGRLFAQMERARSHRIAS